MAVSKSQLTPSQLRSIQEIIVAGEALRIVIRVRAAAPGPTIDLDELKKPSVHSKLERAGRRAVKKAMSGGYDVTLEHCDCGELVYRVSGYKTLGNRLFTLPTLPGVKLETQVLDVMSSLVSKARKIASAKVGGSVVASAEAQPGEGLLMSGGLLAQRPDESLEAQLPQLQSEWQDFRARAWLSFPAGLAFLAVFGIGGTIAGFAAVGWTAGVLLGLCFCMIGMQNRSRAADRLREISELRDQQDLDVLLEERERLAQKQFQVHGHQLRRYYEQALRQRGVIFAIGVLCIGGGFGIIIAAGLLIWLGNAELSEQIVLAALGAVGGILGNFVAVMYLNMFKETIKSIGAFHDRLVFTNHLHFANVLAAKVTNDDERNKVLVEMALAMAARDADAPLSAATE
jgi:hypothetical protein